MMGLQKRLQRYFNLLNAGFDFSNEIKEVKKKMEVLSDKVSKGIIIRSKEQEIEEGEKCTRYLKKITQRGAIAVLKVEGEEVHTTTEILKVIETFYEDLCDTKVTDDDTMTEVLKFQDKKVNSQDKILPKDSTFLEMDKALKSFKRLQGWMAYPRSFTQPFGMFYNRTY